MRTLYTRTHVHFECHQKCKNVYLCKNHRSLCTRQNLLIVWINQIERNVALRTRKRLYLYVNGTLLSLKLTASCIFCHSLDIFVVRATILGNGELYLPLIVECSKCHWVDSTSERRKTFWVNLYHFQSNKTSKYGPNTCDRRNDVTSLSFSTRNMVPELRFNLICPNMSTNISGYLNITQIVSITGDNNILLPVF